MRILLYILVVNLLYNCNSPRKLEKDIQERFKNVFDTTDKGISKLIDINGIYIMECPGDSLHDFKYLFFADGTFFNGVGVLKKNDKKEIKEFWSIPFNSEEMVRGTTMGEGFYELKGDTIVANSLQPPLFGKPTYFMTVWFKIIDNRHLRIIKPGNDPEPNTVQNCSIVFHNWEQRPASTNWLMYEKWYWKNPEDWEAFMKTKNGK